MQNIFIILLSVVILATGCSPNSPSTAAGSTESASNHPIAEVREPLIEPILSEEIMPEAKLSTELRAAFLKEVAQQENIAMEQLTIQAIKEADWPDGCLGLAGPDEFCTQMIVPGWAIAVTDGTTAWNYRTDLEMLQVKLDPS